MPIRLSPPSFANRSIIVVGEAILDRYQSGTVRRISREAPIPVITETHSFSRCGGAANTAANITALNSVATLVAGRGNDASGNELASACEDAGIQNYFHTVDTVATAVKTRFMSSGQQLLRVDACDDQSSLAEKIKTIAATNLAGHDAMVLSDYGLNALKEAPAIIANAQAHGVPVIVDPREANWSRYAGASLVTPNLEEFLAASDNQNENLALRANYLMTQHDLGAILLTAGAQGMTLYQPDIEPILLPTRSVDVFDVTGAGDTVIAMMALGIAAGADLEEAARWANIGASIVIGKLGTTTASPEELITPPTGHGGHITDVNRLVQELDIVRSAGKKIVMTNGCFDIFHAGHLESLAAAAHLGDILVVGVNDDESVKLLKGHSRPVIALKERMRVLAGLGCVDYVVPFAGTDATELVRQIEPDTYVKGGDWADSPPPEAKIVIDYGGRVIYQTYQTHISTSSIIDRILKQSS